MKLLHTADWHLGRKLEGRYRHDEQTAVMDEICRIAEDENVDAVLIAGDVYDTFNPPAESEALFYETMTRMSNGGRRGVVLIAGNHDSPDRLTASEPYGRALGIATLGYPKDVPATFDRGPDRIACIDTAESFVRLRFPDGRTLAVLALPYPSESRLREVLSATIEDADIHRNYNARVREFLAEAAERFHPDEPSVIISHLFLIGGLESDSERQIQAVGGAYTVDPLSFPTGAGYVGLGHLHRPQEFTGRDDLSIRYAGSPLQYSFSEAGQQKSVTIVEFEGTDATHREIPLSSGRPLIRNDKLRGLGELERFLDEADPDAWISFTVTLKDALPLGYLETLNDRHRGILKHIFLYEEEEGTAGDLPPVDSLPLEEQFRRFVRTRGEEPDDDVVNLFLQLATGEDTEEAE